MEPEPEEEEKGLGSWAAAQDYERFTREIYEKLLGAEGIENVQVQHNIKLKGRSECRHQIDVSWEFRQAGIKHSVAIECKHLGDRLTIGHVRNFFGALHDIGNTRGIIVTKVGYQAGAKQFAEHYGIELRLLRFPLPEDWEGLIKVIGVHLKFFATEVKSVTPLVDAEWLKATGKAKKGDTITLSQTAYNNQVFVYDESGKPIASILELSAKLPVGAGAEKARDFELSLPNTYFDIPAYGKVRIHGLRFIYDIHCDESDIRVDAEEFVKAVLKDVRTGESKFFYND